MATSHFAFVCFALLHLHAVANSDEDRSHTTTDGNSAILPRASHLSLAMDAPPTAAGWPASSSHYRAPASPYAVPDASAPRHLDASTAALQDTAASPRAAVASDLLLSGSTDNGRHPHASASPTARVRDTPSSTTGRLLSGPPFFGRRTAPPSPPVRRDCENTALTRAAPTCPRVSFVNGRAAASDAIVPAPRGVTSSGVPPAMKTLLDALPLLVAITFLPPPVAALATLSSLATLVGAWSDCTKLTHATCAVYKYDNETGTIDRRRPDPSLNAKCEHPLCTADYYNRAALHAQQHGRGDDPLLLYCVVRVLEYPPSILPWLNVWLTQMPVADPAAAAASGDRVCYVELTHLAYREGYYIRCPVGEGRHSTCIEFPREEITATALEEIAATVWEHRRLNYRDTVWPRHAATTTAKHDEL
ncbi:hypothetical protein ACP70R_022425 [Stipagrostis hirtigluma subsp. patula]